MRYGVRCCILPPRWLARSACGAWLLAAVLVTAVHSAVRSEPERVPAPVALPPSLRDTWADHSLDYHPHPGWKQEPRKNGEYNESTALYLAHITSVSYCHASHVSNWTCGPCALVPPLLDAHVVEDTKDNFQGLVGYSSQFDAIVIAFRGSMDVSNWINNLSFFKKRAYTEFPGVMVHEGFYWVYRTVADQILTRIAEIHKTRPGAQLIVTGHSLGGAVAAICAFEMQYLEKLPVRMLYTFGKPRVGNANFSALLVNASFETYRLTHFRDVVPHLPPHWVGFHHMTQEIFYDEFSSVYVNCSRTDGEDPACSNNCSPFGCSSVVDHLTYLNITMSHLIC